MFENLTDKFERAFKVLKGQGQITEINVAETLKEVRRALLDADVNFNTAKNFTNTVKEKALGLEVKEYLKHCLEGAEDIVIQTEKPDSSEKYGRILGWLFINDEDTSLNEKMINEGYAWEYDGGTKKKDFESLLAKRSNS